MLRGCIDCTDGLLVPHEEKFLRVFIQCVPCVHGTAGTDCDAR